VRCNAPLVVLVFVRALFSVATESLRPVSLKTRTFMSPMLSISSFVVPDLRSATASSLFAIPVGPWTGPVVSEDSVERSRILLLSASTHSRSICIKPVQRRLSALCFFLLVAIWPRQAMWLPQRVQQLPRFASFSSPLQNLVVSSAELQIFPKSP